MQDAEILGKGVADQQDGQVAGERLVARLI